MLAAHLGNEEAASGLNQCIFACKYLLLLQIQAHSFFSRSIVNATFYKWVFYKVRTIISFKMLFFFTPTANY